MAAVAARPVAVIGLGCIGGSIARGLRAQEVEVRGWSASPEDRALAKAAGVTVAGSEHDGGIAALNGVRLAVLAVPIDALPALAPRVSRALSARAVAVHVGGLQRKEALRVDDATFARVLGTHPLAGSHDSGFAASRGDLFVGCAVSIESRADPPARKEAEWLWRTLGAARIDYRAAHEHDRLMAQVSHLPQLVATALAATLAHEGVDPLVVGTGARDTTRLAASALGSWPHLLSGAPEELHAALTRLERTIAELRTAIEHDDRARLAELWERARSWRRQAELRS